MRPLMRVACLGVLSVGFFCLTGNKADAQVAVGVTTYRPAPAVVSYAPVRWGFFGRRVIYRPVITPVAPAPVAPAPVAPAPVVSGYAPTTTYYAPAPVAPAVPVYRVPVTTYSPIILY